MTDIVLSARAQRDAAAARDWYDEQVEGLGDDFLDELRAALARVADGPLHYQLVLNDLRRALLRRFPYSVFHLVEQNRVVVVGILHQARNPEVWTTL